MSERLKRNSLLYGCKREVVEMVAECWRNVHEMRSRLIHKPCATQPTCFGGTVALLAICNGDAVRTPIQELEDELAVEEDRYSAIER